MDCEEIKSAFNRKKHYHGIQFEPKPEQVSVAKAVLQGRNCIGFLPTGFGKTLCFVINTIVLDRPSITLVISPLLSLMDNQIEVLSQWRFSCARISGDISLEEAQGNKNTVSLFMHL